MPLLKTTVPPRRGHTELFKSASRKGSGRQLRGSTATFLLVHGGTALGCAGKRGAGCLPHRPVGNPGVGSTSSHLPALFTPGVLWLWDGRDTEVRVQTCLVLCLVPEQQWLPARPGLPTLGTGGGRCHRSPCTSPRSHGPGTGHRHKDGSSPSICAPNTDASTLLHLCSAIFQLKGLIMP